MLWTSPIRYRDFQLINVSRVSGGGGGGGGATTSLIDAMWDPSKIISIHLQFYTMVLT